MNGYVALDGKIVPFNEARVSVFDRGFLYGDGFFETIRVERGYPLFFETHLERLYDSCSAFNIHLGRFPPEFWESIISQLISKNDLSNKLAVVKILVSRGDSFPDLGLPSSDKPTVVIFARPYTPHRKLTSNWGLDLFIYPQRRHSLIADHKSLNYLFYLTAKEWAKGQGGDEAIILNADGTVSEGATSNIFYVRSGRVYKPSSSHYLEGVMEQHVIKFLENRGIEVTEKATTVDDLVVADEVFITNSLIEVKAARSIDRDILSQQGEIVKILTKQNWVSISRDYSTSPSLFASPL